MPKIKSIARSPHIDMTPMVDLFSLLLTFFILTATFRPVDPAKLTIPNSVSEKIAPDNDIMTIFISTDKKIYFNFDNGKDTSKHFRAELLKAMATQYKINFTPKEITQFSRKTAFGMPMAYLKQWLNTEDSKESDKFQVGIPTDSIDNQFAWWVRSARTVNTQAQVAIKADGNAPYPIVKKVLDLIQKNGINKFNFVTTYDKQEVGIKDIPKQ